MEMLGRILENSARFRESGKFNGELERKRGRERLFFASPPGGPIPRNDENIRGISENDKRNSQTDFKKIRAELITRAEGRRGFASSERD